MANDNVLGTYRYLRVGMPLLVVLLGAAITHQIFAGEPDCWLGSISAYYYTAARAVFVAALCAIGACMIIHRGNTRREDVALNAGGFLAFFVAFIPTPLEGPDPLRAEPVCRRSNVPTDQQLTAAIDNNLAALLFAAAVAVAVAWAHWARSADTRTTGGTRALIASTAFVSAVVLLFWFGRELLRDYGHITAAVGLFLAIGVVVAMSAFALPRFNPGAVAPSDRFRTIYRVIFAAMVFTAAVIIPLAIMDRFDHAVFWLEAAEIALFAAYWIAQTFELDGSVTRRDLHETRSGVAGAR